jgi:hypothetical protein
VLTSSTLSRRLCCVGGFAANELAVSGLYVVVARQVWREMLLGLGLSLAHNVWQCLLKVGVRAHCRYLRVGQVGTPVGCMHMYAACGSLRVVQQRVRDSSGQAPLMSSWVVIPASTLDRTPAKWVWGGFRLCDLKVLSVLCGWLDHQQQGIAQTCWAALPAATGWPCDSSVAVILARPVAVSCRIWGV